MTISSENAQYVLLVILVALGVLAGYVVCVYWNDGRGGK